MDEGRNYINLPHLLT